MLDPHASIDIDPVLEDTIWSMVDYGLMCSSSPKLAGPDSALSLPMKIPSPSPSFLDFEMDLTTGDDLFTTSDTDILTGTYPAMSTYNLDYFEITGCSD